MRAAEVQSVYLKHGLVQCTCTLVKKNIAGPSVLRNTQKF